MLTVDVSGALTAAGYERDVIDRIIQALTSAESSVRQGKDISPVPAASFGSSATAAELGLHAGKAHNHVVEAMTQLVAGLENYHAGVRRFREDVHETDQRNADDLGTVTRRAEQVDVATLFRRGDECNGSGNFYDTNACEAPTAEADL
jgi:hypothetical protein